MPQNALLRYRCTPDLMAKADGFRTVSSVFQILALANLYPFVFVSIVLLDTRRIGSAFVDIYQAGFAVGPDRFVEEA